MSRSAHPQAHPPGPPDGATTTGIAQRMIEHLTTAVLVFDPALRLRALNPAAEALLEVSANQVRGHPVQELVPRAERFLAALDRVARTGEPVAEREMHLEVGASGAAPIVDCVVTPVGDDSPHELLVEIVQLDRHVQITRETRLLAQSESARALLRGLAHEIKNPLGGLRGAAQLLERELEDADLKEYTQVIVHEADRLRGLVDRLLGPREMPNMRPVNVHQVTERVYALLRAEAPPAVRVERDYDPSIPDIVADPELLIQAVLNIARNALEAVDGEGEVVLRTRVQRQPTIAKRRHRLAVRVEISDDGRGVPEPLGDRIFYPMVSGRSGGTGLGLSIAHAVVHQHGGQIECRSEPGDTTFCIVLPLDAHEDTEDDA